MHVLASIAQRSTAVSPRHFIVSELAMQCQHACLREGTPTGDAALFRHMVRMFQQLMDRMRRKVRYAFIGAHKGKLHCVQNRNLYCVPYIACATHNTRAAQQISRHVQV